ncbi:hypothetical protein BH11MYX2_BH11MYX2_13730 [soil metagenome]
MKYAGVLTSSALLVACGLGPKAVPPGPGDMAGNVPLVLRNESSVEVCEVQLHNRASETFRSYLVCRPTPLEVNSGYSHDTCQGPCLAPGESREFSVTPGTYDLLAHRTGGGADGTIVTIDLKIANPVELSYGQKRAHPPGHDGLTVIDAEYVAPPPAGGYVEQAPAGACTPNGGIKSENHDCCNGFETQDSQNVWRCSDPH